MAKKDDGRQGTKRRTEEEDEMKETRSFEFVLVVRGRSSLDGIAFFCKQPEIKITPGNSRSDHLLSR